MKKTSLLLSALFTLSCSAGSNNSSADVDLNVDVNIDIDSGRSDSGGSDMGKLTLQYPDRCISASGWKQGKAAFENTTQSIGLDTINARGVRISAVDYDGDGHSDLFIRNSGSDNFEDTRVTWLLRNKGDGTFEDLTQSSGIVKTREGADENLGRPAEVAAFGDIDNDGDLDLVSAFTNDGSSLEGAELMLNQGDGTFALGAENLRFRKAGEATTVGGLTLSDINRDGLLDLWVGHGSVNGDQESDELYIQKEDSAFFNETLLRGLQTQKWTIGALNQGVAHTNAWSTAACDLNNDGRPDLLAASYGRAPNTLFRNTGEVFENISLSSGYAFDARQDWKDNESARCWCKLHPTDEGCGTPAPGIVCNVDADAFRWNHDIDREPFRLGGNSGTSVCGDINNDGHLDILTTEIVHWDVGSSSDPSEILLNDGANKPVFERPGNESTGLTRTHSGGWNDGDITGALFDFDNDGRLDVLINSTSYDGTRALLYHQKEDGTFEAVSISEGIDQTSPHGVGVADFDRDGDLDVVLGHARFRCSTGDHCYESPHVRYFENKTGQDSNWVQIQLEGGDKTNRSAIGARITIESGGLIQTKEIDGGHGHYGIQHDLVAHFGLGHSCEAKVTVRWPDSELSEQSFNVQAGYRYQLKQGEDVSADTSE